MDHKLSAGPACAARRAGAILFALFLGTSRVIAATPSAVSGPDRAATNDFNLILISLTNTRADHLGLYGYHRNTSTNLDRFARKCLVFRDAFAHASWTLPAVMSLFTSQYPFEHGLMNREQAQPLPESVPTFVDVLKTNGYLTAAFVGDRDYGRRFGHVSRFHHIFDPVQNTDWQDWKSYGVLSQTLPPAREWLRQNKDRKFFMLVQGYDTHCPFAIPKADRRFDPDYRGKIDFTKCYWTFEPTRPVKMRLDSGLYREVFLLKTRPTDGEDYEVMFQPEDVRHMIALYDGEICNADQLIGGLLDDLTALGLEKNTVVVFYSDHGDMFGKYGRFMRGGPLRGTFYDDVLRIPLLIYHPALPPKTVRGLAQAVYLAPTLLDLLGQRGLTGFRGKSLRSLITQNVPANEYVFAGAAFTPSANNPFFRHPSVIVAVRSLKWKLIVERVVLGPGPQEMMELYDLEKDPEELTNVLGQRPEILDPMKAALHQWLRQVQAERWLPPL